VKPGPTVIVHTLDSIKALCVMDGECWTWTRAKSKEGQPKTRHEGQVWSVRRLVYKLNSRAVRGGYTPVPVKCGNPACVNPYHLAEREVSKYIAEQNKARPETVTKRAKIAERRRAESPLTWELVNEIRVSDKPSSQWASELGVHHKTIRRVVNYETWKDYSTPWAGLMS
jgi:hypothetical protein